jgi:signal transduction histidine kinase
VDDMRLKYDLNDIKISYNGISYRSNKKLIYKYMLIKEEDTLSSITSNREVEFLSLHHGKYLFLVTAKNSSGIWSESPAAFSFIIQPAWWQTGWFRFLLLVSLGAGVLFFYRSKVKKLKREFETERRQASLQLTAMRAQMNPHFIFNVMNSIRNYMQNHDMKSAEKYLTSFSKLVRYTLDNSEVQEVTLEEELQALRNYAELEMQRFENGFEYHVTCEAGIDTKETMLLSMLLQPFVENSIKHGINQMEKGGKILIDIRKQNDSVFIAIEDNGVGIQEAKRRNESENESHISHGTELIFERIKAYNKVYNKNIKTRIINLTGDDDRPAGTRVEVEL